MSALVTSMTPLIEVHDMAEAVRFYSDAIGFELVEHSADVDAPEGRHFQFARLRLGQIHLMLNTLYDIGERPPQRDPGQQAANGHTYLFFNTNELDAVIEKLRAAGVEPGDPIDQPYGMRQIYLKDPDGYSLCFQQRT